MSDLVIGEPLASRIREIAREENRSPEDIIETIVKHYPLLKMALSSPRIDSLLDEARRESLEYGNLSDFPVDDLGSWPQGLSLSREDMYGDNGR